VALVNAGAHSKHIKMARCDIKPRSVKRSKEVENEKKSKGIPTYPTSKTLQYFCMTLKTF
jgi:hypothetical protein